ncbi:MAG TPA: tRNA (adenosine(37)-N6)-threonylcarbamoyltransferase complex transferase subunit TsaD [Acidimicrobiales bacterium]|nr:tRNA (adenosine(37)-N6)-threonylcarbamoyltransferase complex transferase subunit TsaD [Acidimicrobiales bacterium]
MPVNATLRVLAIETSCDETAAAVVGDGHHVLSSVVSSQTDIHATFGGVVPEIASRAHLELLGPVVKEAMDRAGVAPGDLSAVAATIGPGLIGSLLVGVSAAKAYAWSWGLPFVGVNHMEGHLHAAFLEDPALSLPTVVLLVSGGHTLLICMQAADQTARDGGVNGRGFEVEYRLLGQTIDDAAGEAFDKVARFLGMGYPGGPAIERAAIGGRPEAVAFPRGLAGSGFDFSFSGLKTSVIRYMRANPDAPLADVAASFQEAVVDVLVTKAQKAAAEVGAKGICLGGGVAANTALRERVKQICTQNGYAAFIPSRAMCTDNAAMIGAAACYRLKADGPTRLDAAVDPNLRLPLV